MKEKWSYSESVESSEIVNLESKYGHFILMKPELNLNTFILWSSPIWAGFIGIFLVYFIFKHK